MKARILVIRGGAIGDFILTLPGLRLVREAFPAADVELIGYRHIAALAERRHYANAVRSIEYGPLAGFFARGGTLDEELCHYFSGFQQVISYLFDPDGIFEGNLRKAGVKNYLPAYTAIDDSAHAAYQLARPLQRLALYLDDPAALVFPSPEDFAFADGFIEWGRGRVTALHPGSGSARKNWPLNSWRDLIDRLLSASQAVLIVGGEAERATLRQFEEAFPGRLSFARDLPLPHLGAVLARCGQFIGHDSGISHLAAAVGTPSLLLFGPTDAQVWAPANAHAKVLASPDGDLSRIKFEDVIRLLEDCA